MKTLRIFISSPGDVEEERNRARQVVEQLRRRYAGQLDLKPVLWEELPLQADTSFQQGIDLVLSDQGIDIAVFILWSRLGSPIGPLIRKDDGTEYRSGTEREFDLMLQAREQSDGQRPDILVYTRDDDHTFDERLRGKPTSEKDSLLQQKVLVENFIQEEFHDSSGRTNLRAYHSFDRPVTFTSRLRVHLQELLDPLVTGLSGPPVWEVEEKGSPFLGLEAFQPQHAPVFFGREDEILEARQALRRQARAGCAFLLIAGASGAGKSSLARAGILPAIVEYEVDDTISHWQTLILTPGELGPDPLAGFAQHLAKALPSLQDENAGDTRAFAEDIRTNADMLVRRVILPALAQTKAPGDVSAASPRLLLVVDQLEELLSGTDWNDTDRLAFAELLEALARSGQVWVLATLRADFLGSVQTLPPLAQMRSAGGQSDLLAPDVAALRQLIAEPARLAGLRFEERDGKSLTDTILSDAAGFAELLPLLSHLLEDLFEHRTPDNVLTFERYEQVGGVGGALARHADATYSSDQLDDAARNQLGPVLRRLVTLSGDDETVYVRQYPALESFSPAQRRLVDAFINARLLVTTPDGNVTLAHEILLRVWVPAHTWVSGNADFLRTRARVEARRKQGGLLLEGDPLLDLAKLHLGTRSRDPASDHEKSEDQDDFQCDDGFTPDQRSYLQDSLDAIATAQRQRERSRRRVIAALSVLALVSLVGGLLAAWQWQHAEQQRAEAEKQKEISEQTVQFITGMFEQIDPAIAQGREITVREVLDQASENIDGSFERNPETEWQIRTTLEIIYSKIGRAKHALKHANVMLSLANSIHAGRDHQEVALSLGRIAYNLDDLGKNSQAKPIHEAVLAMRLNLHQADHPEVADSITNIAYNLQMLGSYEEALKKYQSALEMQRRLHNGDHPSIATALNNVGYGLQALKRNNEALHKHKAALEMRQRFHKKDLTKVATSLNNVASCLQALDRKEEALQYFLTALEMLQRLHRRDHVFLASALNNIGGCLNSLGRFEEAVPYYQAGLEMNQRLFPNGHQNVANSLNNLAYCLQALGHYKKSLALYEDALRMNQRTLVDHHPKIANSHLNLANCYLDLDQLTQAQQHYAMWHELLKKNGIDWVVVATQVLANSQAERLGISTGDIILEQDGETVYTMQQFVRMRQNSKGRRAKLVLERDGKRIELDTEGGTLGVAVQDVIRPLAGAETDSAEPPNEAKVDEREASP